jgi:hypothetical protein
MAFATRSIDNVELRNNAAIVAEAAKIFDVAHILTSVAERTFSGPLFPEILATFPAEPIVDRTTMNCWEDERITSLVNASGCGKVVVCGLWTSVCIVGPALSALDQGFDVYVIADACGDVTTEAHELAMTRMAQAGAHPMTSLQYLLELQRDWARAETYDAVTGVARTHGGGYGLGLVYASAMLGGHASEAGAQAPAAAAAVGGRG